MLSSAQELARFGRVGSSTAAAIVGLDPYCTPYQAWRMLVDPSARNDLTHSTPVKLGIAFERAIVGLVREQWNLQTTEIDPAETRAHPLYPHYIAHPDALVVGEHAGVEVKFRSAYARSSYPDGDCRDSDYIQTQWQILVWQFVCVYFCVVFGNDEIRHLRIEPNAEDADFLINEVGEFYERYVRTGIPPPPTTAQDVRSRWPRSREGAMLEASVQTMTHVQDLLALQAHQAELEKEANRLKDAIVLAFDDSEALAYDGRVIATYKSQQRRDLDAKRLRKEHPEIAAQFEREHVYRVLRLKDEAGGL